MQNTPAPTPGAAATRTGSGSRSRPRGSIEFARGSQVDRGFGWLDDGRPAGPRPAAAAVDHDPHDARLRARRSARAPGLRRRSPTTACARSGTRSRTASTAAGSPRSRAGPVSDDEQGGVPALVRAARRGRAARWRGRAAARGAARRRPRDVVARAVLVRGRGRVPARAGTAAGTSSSPTAAPTRTCTCVEAFLAAGDATGDAALVRARAADRRAADPRRRRAHTTGGSSSTSTRSGARCPTTTRDQPAPPVPAVRRHARATASSGRGCCSRCAPALPAPPDWLTRRGPGRCSRARRPTAGSASGGLRRTRPTSTGQPVVARPAALGRSTEAIGAAAALHATTGDAEYEHWYRTLWDFAELRT